MIGVWDWHHPRRTPADEASLATLVADVGFDTLIVGRPTPNLVSQCHSRGVTVNAVVTPTPDDEFVRVHPESLQKMLPAEEAAAGLLRDLPDRYQADAGRWFPIFQPTPLVCYQHPESQALLAERVCGELEVADGIALDGFGFRNHHRCYCPRCVAAVEDGRDPVGYARASLLDATARLNETAKACSPEAVVMNHVWPPFRPDPRYAAELQLDYASETVSWFYPPVWDLARVELELRLLSAESRRNTFVPFIGLFWQDRCRRGPQRLGSEIARCRSFEPRHLVFSTLSGIVEDEEIRRVVAQELQRYRRGDS